MRDPRPIGSFGTGVTCVDSSLRKEERIILADRIPKGVPLGLGRCVELYNPLAPGLHSD